MNTGDPETEPRRSLAWPRDASSSSSSASSIASYVDCVGSESSGGKSNGVVSSILERVEAVETRLSRGTDMSGGCGVGWRGLGSGGGEAPGTLKSYHTSGLSAGRQAVQSKKEKIIYQDISLIALRRSPYPIRSGRFVGLLCGYRQQSTSYKSRRSRNVSHEWRDGSSSS